MKKFKKIVVSALAVVMVFCVMVTPASALTEEKVRTDSDSDTLGSYDWAYTLKTTETRTTATVSVDYIGHGALLTSISAEVNGHIVNSNNREVTLNNIATAGAGAESVYVQSIAEAGTGYTVTQVVCTLYANGHELANYTYSF